VCTKFTTAHVVTMLTFSTVVTVFCEVAIIFSWILCSHERTRNVAMCRQFLSC
jgi:hypothetical protein